MIMIKISYEELITDLKERFEEDNAAFNCVSTSIHNAIRTAGNIFEFKEGEN